MSFRWKSFAVKARITSSKLCVSSFHKLSVYSSLGVELNALDLTAAAVMGGVAGCKGALASANKIKSNTVAIVELIESSSCGSKGVDSFSASFGSVDALKEWYLQPESIFQASLSPQSQQPPPPEVMENEVSWPWWFELWKHREQKTQVSSRAHVLFTRNGSEGAVSRGQSPSETFWQNKKSTRYPTCSAKRPRPF